MNKIKQAVKQIVRWALKEELEEISKIQDESTDLLNKIKLDVLSGNNYVKGIRAHYQRLDEILGNMDVSVDVHEYAPSWAVISIQGQKEDYIKFIDLGRSDITEIQRFLGQFDRSKVDASPQTSKFLRIESKNKRKSW